MSTYPFGALKPAKFLYHGEFHSKFSPTTGQVDEEVFGGLLASIARRSRAMLGNLDDLAIHHLLELVDCSLQLWIDDGLTFVDKSSGERTLATQDGALERVSPTDVLASVAATFRQEVDFKLLDGEPPNERTIEFTLKPEIALAAYALKECFLACSISHVDWLTLNGGMHAIQAATALAYAESLANDDDAAQQAIRQSVRSEVVAKLGAHAANSRWARLEPVKKLAFERRAEMQHLSRSAAIDRMLPEILEAWRGTGEAPTGASPKDTITRWFRDAGVK